MNALHVPALVSLMLHVPAAGTVDPEGANRPEGIEVSDALAEGGEGVEERDGLRLAEGVGEAVSVGIGVAVAFPSDRLVEDEGTHVLIGSTRRYSSAGTPVMV